MIAVFQGDPAVLEFAHADFRPLQVGQNTDRTTDPGGDFTHRGGQRDVVFGPTVRS